MQTSSAPPPPPPPPAVPSDTASDNFTRPDGTLGSNWSVLSNFGGSDGGIQLLNNAFAPTSGLQTGFPTSIGTWVGPGAFGPNQFTKVQLSAVAPEQSVVAITGATASGSNTVYTYTLTSGQALQSPQPINISGMANGSNNGAFIISALDTGTFTVPNAQGITATGQNGMDISATDSLCGPAVRSTPGVLNTYYLYVGNNSGYVSHDDGTTDARLYVVELWKFVNGTSEEIQQISTDNSIPDSPGDIYHLFALGNKVAVYKNSVSLAVDMDTSIDSGVPGIEASSATGAGNPVPLASNLGVDAMQCTNWVGSSAPSTPTGWVAQAAETFLVQGPAPNPPWSQTPGFLQVPTFNSKTGETGFNGMSSLIYTGRNWANDQSSSIVVSTVEGSTSFSLVVRASPSAETFYLAQFHFNNGFGAGVFTLQKFVEGTATVLATTSGTVNFADVLRVEVVGTTLTYKQNGTSVLTATDSSVTDGSPGVLGGGNANIMFWEGDEPTPTQ